MFGEGQQDALKDGYCSIIGICIGSTQTLPFLQLWSEV